MRLADLDPSFLVPQSADCYHMTDEIAGARGVTFQCPHCMRAKPDGVGVHYILCWTPLVPEAWEPGPGRWELQGTGYADLTLVAGSSSVAIGFCGAHFWVRDGAIVFC